MTTSTHDHVLDYNGADFHHVFRGNRFVYVVSGVLFVSSIFKLAQPAQAVAYMGSMGYSGGTYFLIAGLEIVTAILFLLRATRRLGGLLASAYFGGAISAHLATHPPVTIGPGLHYLTTHPYVAALLPSAFLVAAWIGVWRTSTDS